MRIVSFLPAATEVLFALGAGRDVVGVSHECQWPAEVSALPQVTSTVIRTSAPSRKIDEQVSSALKAGDSIYRVDAELLRALKPDLIITQQLCEVCAITPSQVQTAIGTLKPSPAVLSLHPHSIQDIFEDIRLIGRATGRQSEAKKYVDGLRRRLDAVSEVTAGVPHRPRVYCMEWLDPPYNAGHWVPEQVELAGGRDEIAREGGDSVRLMWDKIVDYDPEVLVLMPCGLSMERIMRETAELADERWRGLSAWRNSRVYAVNGAAYFNNSGPRVVDGAELLASVLHPGVAGELGRKFGSKDVRQVNVQDFIPYMA